MRISERARASASQASCRRSRATGGSGGARTRCCRASMRSALSSPPLAAATATLAGPAPASAVPSKTTMPSPCACRLFGSSRFSFISLLPPHCRCRFLPSFPVVFVVVLLFCLRPLRAPDPCSIRSPLSSLHLLVVVPESRSDSSQPLPQILTMVWGCGWELEERDSWLYQAKSAAAIRCIGRTDRGTDRSGAATAVRL